MAYLAAKNILSLCRDGLSDQINNVNKLILSKTECKSH